MIVLFFNSVLYIIVYQYINAGLLILTNIIVDNASDQNIMTMIKTLQLYKNTNQIKFSFFKNLDIIK